MEIRNRIGEDGVGLLDNLEISTPIIFLIQAIAAIKKCIGSNEQ